MSEILTIQAEATESHTNNGKPRKPASYSSGLIFNKDGKVCRTCNAFRDLMSLSPKRKTTSSALDDQFHQQLPNCPPDVESLGRATWTFLHTMAANYPEQPTVRQQLDMSSFMSTLGRFYPCWHCAGEFREWMATGNQPRVQSRRDFEEWMCRAHNEVNRKLGKPEFDCGTQSLSVRWGDGPKDGSCG